MKLTSLVAAIAVAGTVASQAAVTATFNSAFAGGVSANFADAGGTVSNGLFYGILVDGAGNGFLTTYDEVVPALGPAAGNVGLALTSGGLASDDRLYFAQDLTSDTSLLLEGDFLTSGGNGGITGVAFDFAGDVGAGDVFGIVWFDGISAGLLEDGSFVVPADGNVSTFDGPFVGADPVRSATGLTFGVPEPSVALLGALGIFGLIRRRR